MDEYKKSLRAAIDKHIKGNDGLNPFEDFGYGTYAEIDAMCLDLHYPEEILGFSIDYTAQGKDGNAYLTASYWSDKIRHRIEIGDIEETEDIDAFVDACAAIKSHVDSLENQLPKLKK